MIKVHYEHPPRKWDFYGGYLLWLFIVLSPCVLLFLLWANHLAPSTNITVAIFLVLTALSYVWKPTLALYIAYYDMVLPKSRDISHQANQPPASLRQALEFMERQGFRRLGEASTYFGLAEQEIIVWLLVHESDQTVVELFELENGFYHASFYTWFEGERVVTTGFPVGETLVEKNFHARAIPTSLEGCYDYHLRQVDKFTNAYGEALKIPNLESYSEFTRIYREKFIPRLFRLLRNRYFIYKMSEVATFSAAIYIFPMSCFALSQVAGTDGTKIGMMPILSLIILIISIIIRNNISSHASSPKPKRKHPSS